MYYIYMLRCKDNSIYTGITTDLQRRIEEHITKGKKCAKYTMRHTAVKLEQAWQTETRVNASKLEYRIKHLNKEQKEEIIHNPQMLKILENKIDVNEYKNVKEPEQ